MVPFFNISSAGATATGWITHLLNHDPRINCYHSLRADPFLYSSPVGAAENWMNATTAIQGLKGLRLCTEDFRSIGLCHSFYTSRAHGVRAAFLAADGRHAVMFRNIIQRLHSALCYNAPPILGAIAAGPKLYEMMSNKYKESDIGYSEIMTFSELNPAEAKFLDIALQFVMFDLDNWLEAPPEEVLLFEKVISDDDYLLARLERLLDDDMNGLREPIRLTRSNPQHQHSGGDRRTDDDWFFMWPESFRRLFVRVILDGGILAVRRMYEGLGYSYTPGISQYIDYVTSEAKRAGALEGINPEGRHYPDDELN